MRLANLALNRFRSHCLSLELNPDQVIFARQLDVVSQNLYETDIFIPDLINNDFQNQVMDITLTRLKSLPLESGSVRPNLRAIPHLGNVDLKHLLL